MTSVGCAFRLDRIRYIGRLAQRPRALALQARSRRFESSTAHHSICRSRGKFPIAQPRNPERGCSVIPSAVALSFRAKRGIFPPSRSVRGARGDALAAVGQAARVDLPASASPAHIASLVRAPLRFAKGACCLPPFAGHTVIPSAPMSFRAHPCHSEHTHVIPSGARNLPLTLCEWGVRLPPFMGEMPEGQRGPRVEHPISVIAKGM